MVRNKCWAKVALPSESAWGLKQKTAPLFKLDSPFASPYVPSLAQGIACTLVLLKQVLRQVLWGGSLILSLGMVSMSSTAAAASASVSSATVNSGAVNVSTVARTTGDAPLASEASVEDKLSVNSVADKESRASIATTTSGTAVANKDITPYQDSSIWKTVDARHFTGSAWQVHAFEQTPPARAYGGLVAFAPGARTYWHSHPLGQTLIVVSGEGYVQEEGQPKCLLKVGDIVVCPPQVKHWHGAAPHSTMEHWAFSEHAENQAVTWYEPVSTADYTAK